jgi:hypothetical protein
LKKGNFNDSTIKKPFSMKRIIIALCSGLITLFLSSPAPAQEKCPLSEEGYYSLFNGKDLTGWKIPEGDNGHWSVIDGVIDYDARSEAKGSKDLWTVDEFEDFRLHIEWRFKGYGDHLFPLPTILPDGSYVKDANGKTIEPLGPNSDSGILLKGVDQTNLWCWSVGSGEIWGVRNNQDLPAEVRAAAVPSENADQPVGQWNAFDITVKGDRITVVNNGIAVIHNALLPGLDKKGPIGLQHHGGINQSTGKLQGASSLVQFRNIWIKAL